MTFEELKPRFERLRDVVGNHSGALGDLAAIEEALGEMRRLLFEQLAKEQASAPVARESASEDYQGTVALEEPPVKKRRPYKRRQK